MCLFWSGLKNPGPLTLFPRKDHSSPALPCFGKKVLFYSSPDPLYSLLCIAVRKCLSVHLLTLRPRLPCSLLGSLLSASPLPCCLDLTPGLAWQRNQPGSSLLQGHYKEAPLCNGALYQEHNPCDDYLDTILTEPGEPEPKEEFRAKQLLFTGSQSMVSGLVPV